MYEKDQLELIEAEHSYAIKNNQIYSALLFDNHQLHVNLHKKLLNDLSPNKETFLDKIAYFFNFKKRIDRSIIIDHIQDHINFLQL